MTANAYQRLKAITNLPSPTGVALQILRVVNDEESSVDDIADLVVKDPALAARVFKAVNSAWTGKSQRTDTILGAVKLLGRRAVANLALGFSLISRYRNGPCKAFDYEGYWAESFVGAIAARHFARRFGSRLTDQACTCGLLSQIGRLAFATACPQHYAQILCDAKAEPTPSLLDRERRVFGLDHNELAACMMSDWHLPDAYCAATRLQSSTVSADLDKASDVDRLAWVLQVSFIIARALLAGSPLVTLAEDICQRGFKADEFPQLIRHVELEWRESSILFSLPAQKVHNLEKLCAAANR